MAEDMGGRSTSAGALSPPLGPFTAPGLPTPLL